MTVLSFPTAATAPASDVTSEHLRRATGEQAPIAAPRRSPFPRRLAAFAEAFGAGPKAGTLTYTAPDGATVTVELSAGAEQQLSQTLLGPLDSLMEARAQAALDADITPTATGVRLIGSAGRRPLTLLTPDGAA